MTHSALVPSFGAEVALSEQACESAELRLRRAAADHYDFIWRLLRRFGVAETAVDDAAQEVFVVLARRLSSVKHGSERSFLFGTALRVARHMRRRSTSTSTVELDANLAAAPELAPDALYEERRARELLDFILAELDDDARAAFVLFEIEGLTLSEIAELLALPRGTVASRVRRAREDFSLHAKRFRAALEFRGGSR